MNHNSYTYKLLKYRHLLNNNPSKYIYQQKVKYYENLTSGDKEKSIKRF